MYRLTELGKTIIFENWTETTTVEKFVSELKSKGLIPNQELENLIKEFNLAEHHQLQYSANLALTLATELAILEIIPPKNYNSFNEKIKELGIIFGAVPDTNKRDILNFLYRMMSFRNSYAHLKPISFNFIQERQDFVRVLTNIKKFKQSTTVP